MSSGSKQAVIQRILQERVSAIIRTRDGPTARDAMQAAVDGGFRVVEFTMTTPNALEYIQSFANQGDLLVGAGTVLTKQDVRAAQEAGARFVVSPICDAEIIQFAGEAGLVTIPGTFTATEMQTAHEAGADFVKLFPGPPDTPAYVAAILGPLPHLRVFPTSGVTLDNFVDVLKAGAVGVGFVKPLFVPTDLENNDFAAIRGRAETILRILSAS